MNGELTDQDFVDILSHVTFGHWVFEYRSHNGFPEMRVREPEGHNNDDGSPLDWKGRWWPLSRHAVKDEVVLTAFKSVLTAVEHETRELFLYRGRRILGPHMNVDILWEVAGMTSQRVPVSLMPST